jgi:release factor glutamine methyltransferase
LAHPERKLKDKEYQKFILLAKRRSSGEPVAYLAGKKEFFGLDFLVNKNVLVPRPETELLVELSLAKILNTNYSIPDTIIDVGTGSGNIIISLVKNLPSKIQKKINFFAVDISKDALEVAKANAKRHKVEKKIKFIQSDLLGYFLKNKKSSTPKNLFIIANLPYVSPSLYCRNKNNLRFEPKGALLSRRKGLEHYENMFKQISRLLTIKHFSLFAVIEISPAQKLKISRILRKHLPLAKVKFYQDLAGRWRAATIQISSSFFPGLKN